MSRSTGTPDRCAGRRGGGCRGDRERREHGPNSRFAIWVAPDGPARIANYLDWLGPCGAYRVTNYDRDGEVKDERTVTTVGGSARSRRR